MRDSERLFHVVSVNVNLGWLRYLVVRAEIREREYITECVCVCVNACVCICRNVHMFMLYMYMYVLVCVLVWNC